MRAQTQRPVSRRMCGAALRCAAVAAMSAAVSASARPATTPPPRRSVYVATGSSFAAGPGIGEPAAGGQPRCGRSVDNYAHRVAAAHELLLRDASCSGATTRHLLAPWGEIPAQFDAVDGETRLVTVTIGGNDVNYIGLISAYACRHAVDAEARPATRCPAPAPPTEQAWRDLDAALRRIVAAVTRAAPQARLVFVQYPRLVPARGTCATLGIDAAQAAEVRALAKRLYRVTARVGRAKGASVLGIDRLSRGHDACAAVPWTNGVAGSRDRDGVPFHPNRAGMAAQAQALERLIWGG